MTLDGKRILLVRLSAIGDVMHATTVAHNLKLRAPNVHLTWLSSPPASLLLENNPDIDELLLWDRRPFDTACQKLHLRNAKRCLDAAKELLAPYHFDITLDIQGLFVTGLLTKYSSAPRKIGIHERHEGNSLFMTEMGPNIQAKHKVRRYLTALAPLRIDFGEAYDDFVKGPILRLPAQLQTFAKKFWARHGITGKPILFVNVRTTWPSKNWEATYFNKALKLLPEDLRGNFHIVFCGTSSDIPYIAEAMAGIENAQCIAGETNLLELAALFQSAALLLTGDTGPLYIAEAVNLPTLSLWGATHPSIYGPLTAGHDFIISPHECTACGKTKCKQKTNACMNAITPESVANTLSNKLKNLLFSRV